MSTQKLIALLCESADRRHDIANQLRRPETDLVLCATSDDLYLLAMSSRIDAVILEQQLTGFLTGLDILAKLASDLVQPVSILIGDLTLTEKSQAAMLRPSAIMPAAAAAEVMASATSRALLTRNLGVPIPQAARRLVRDAATIGLLPQLIGQMARYLQDPNASVGALAKEISADVRVTAELLKLINSASMGLPSKITRIYDAVNLIGTKRTVALVLSTYVLGTGQSLRKSLPAGLERQLRFRSVLMAATASTYAAMTGQAAPDTAYVLALLQDLGVLVMAQELGNSYQRILERCKSVSQLQLASYEQQQLGYTHADVSAALLQKWELPSGLVALVLHHHQRIEALAGSAEERGLWQVMQVAEAVADVKDQPTPQRQVLLQRLVQQGGRMNQTQLRSCLAQSVAKTLELGQLFSLPLLDEAHLQGLVAQLAAEAEIKLPVPGSRLDAAHSRGRVPPESETSPAALSSAEVSAADRCRVIVLDDDPTTLVLIEEWLSGTEFEAITVQQVSDMWHHVRRADVILCDLHLGTALGTDVLKQLRADGVLMPLFMISQDHTRQSVLDSIEAGASAYLPKPLQRETLLAKLRQQMAQSAGSNPATRNDFADRPPFSAHDDRAAPPQINHDSADGSCDELGAANHRNAHDPDPAPYIALDHEHEPFTGPRLPRELEGLAWPHRL